MYSKWQQYPYSLHGIAQALCIVVAILISFLWSSATKATTEKLQNQRYHYELAKSSLRKKDMQAFAKHEAVVIDYALYPYLEYTQAVRALKAKNNTYVEHFLRKHADTYLGNRLQRQYMHRLAASKQWDNLLFWYKPELASQSMQCNWLYARIKEGDTSAYAEVAPLWTQAKSLPKKCDKLFSRWMKTDYFTDSVVWKRYLLALDKRQNALARYLGSLLPNSYQHYISKIDTLNKQPNLIGRYKMFAKHTPEMQHVIAYGVKKLARKQPKKALKHWQRYEGMQIFDENLVKETKLHLVDQLIRFDHIKDVKRMLVASPSIRQPSAIERLLRELLKEQRWQDIVATIQLLPEDKQAEDRWQYWLARANLSTQQRNSHSLTIYEALSQKRSFYGFMASDHLGKSYTLQNQPIHFDDALLTALANKPALARAKELWLTQRLSEAYAEWYYGLKKLSSKELAAAGVLADKWGWHDRAIHAMIAGQHWNHLDIRFPLAFNQHIMGAAESTDLPPEYIYAIARQESAMSEIAKSSSGARGLMQLMPATAKETAYKTGIKHRTDDLYHAEHNILLGSRYLDELLERFSGNRILATAAYNAGPGRVNQWIRNSKNSLPFDVWIETIPYKETRGYVQNVLTFSVIYSFRMGKPESLLTKYEAKQKL